MVALLLFIQALLVVLVVELVFTTELVVLIRVDLEHLVKEIQVVVLEQVLHLSHQ